MTRLALFDCDGTLVDSQAPICDAMEIAFAGAGLSVPPRATIRAIVGLSLVEALAVLLPHEGDVRHRALADDYKQAFQTMRAQGKVEEPLFDGIADVIAALVADGWLLGVVTGKSDRGLAHVLTRHGLTRHFVTLQTADRHPSKPHPAMVEAAMRDAGAAADQTVVIGDTSYDMVMAQAAGVRALGVGWGYHPIAALHDSGAQAVAATPAELFTLLEPR